MSSTFDSLIGDLTRDYQRVQPKDSLQFCATWFQSRLEEQRARTRDLLATRPGSLSVPSELYTDTQQEGGLTPTISPFARPPRPSIAPSPFGTLNVPGNALISGDRTPPSFRYGQRELQPTSPLTTNSHPNPFASFDTVTPMPISSSDFLHPPNSAIFARRTSVSAESIAVDSTNDEPLPYYPKTDEQIRRIKEAIGNNFIFRDLDEEQERGVLNAIREHRVSEGEVVIRQGDVGEYFYVVESGLLNCFIRSDPLPPTWLSMGNNTHNLTITESKGVKQHSEFGKLVQECATGSSFGELALMYGHPRAASVIAFEDSTLWSLDRITFRTIILKAAHRRRTMYERFLSTVELLSSLDAPERSKIADALVSKVYADGEAVVSEGEMGDTFFFVEEGEAIVTKRVQSNGETRNMRVSVLRQGDYFGELSLLRLAPRAATVSASVRSHPASPRLKVAALDAASFTRLLGPLREIMERKAGEAYGSGGRQTS